MNKYVLVKSDSPKCGMYVNKPGSHNSYTTSILSARKFDSMEEAKRNACENERVVPVDKILERHGF